MQAISDLKALLLEILESALNLEYSQIFRSPYAIYHRKTAIPKTGDTLQGAHWKIEIDFASWPFFRYD
jgi:hypothetical protein